MKKQLHALRDEGYFLAGLGATSHGLYRRLGYSPTAYNFELCLPEDRALQYADEEVGSVAFVPSLKVDELVRFHNRYRLNRSGEISRDDRAWEKIVGADTSWVTIRDQNSILLATAAYSVSYETEKVVMNVGEMFATDARLLRKLWSIVCGFDVADEIRIRAIAPDDPIFAMLVEPARGTSRRFENPWLRILDVELALTARRYCEAGTLVLQVHDKRLPVNDASYRLEVDGSGTAACSKSSDDPDFSLGIADLAATYLGGRSFGMLHAAGSIRENRAGSVINADRLFSCTATPFCSLFTV